MNSEASLCSSTDSEKKFAESAVSLRVNDAYQEMIWSVQSRRAMKIEHLRRMQERTKRNSDLNNKDIVDFGDTGGQSMFHEILPVFIHNNMFGVLSKLR